MIKRTANTAPDALMILWEEKFFRSKQNFKNVCNILGKRGNTFPKPELSIALRQAKFLTRSGKRGAFEYAQRVPYVTRQVESIENDLFSKQLIKSLSNNFATELLDLKLNYGKSGTCSAFLLRKILEKLIFLTFSKNGLGGKLQNAQGKFIGLEAMINLASSEKISGLPFLMPQTADKIKAMKFLGDTSAHNPLTYVDMKTIVPQMPYIITAYEELSKKL